MPGSGISAKAHAPTAARSSQAARSCGLSAINPAQGAENRVSALAVIRETVAAKRVQLRRCLVIDANIELVRIKNPVAGGGKVVYHSRGVRRGKLAKQGHGLR